MNKKTLVFFIASFFITQVFSQSIGYMGKRVIFTHSSFYFPAFQEPSARRTEGFKMNVTKSLGIDLVASNKYTFCFDAKYLLTGVSYSAGRNYQNSAIHSQGSITPAKLIALQYSLALKRFRKKAVAPIGFYVKWEVFYQMYWLKYDTENFYEVNYSYPYTYKIEKADGGSGNIRMVGYGAAYSVGRQRIFNDKIVVDYGIRGAVCLPARNSLRNQVEKSLAENSYNRILSHQFFSLKLGVGFLAF
jgi:hypothetical protein